MQKLTNDIVEAAETATLIIPEGINRKITHLIEIRELVQ